MVSFAMNETLPLPATMLLFVLQRLDACFGEFYSNSIIT